RRRSGGELRRRRARRPGTALEARAVGDQEGRRRPPAGRRPRRRAAGRRRARPPTGRGRGDGAVAGAVRARADGRSADRVARGAHRRGSALMELEGVRHLARSALQNLEAHRRRIDDLNVYPVPDGDTGTNLVLTLRSIVEALEASTAATSDAVAKDVTRA